MKAFDQFRELKAKHPGMLILFRVGDFYESLAEDAEAVAKDCGLTLTRRDTMPMAGFPVARLETYLGILLKAGHRVAVCDPSEAAKP